MNEKTIVIHEIPKGQRRPKIARHGKFNTLFDPDKEQNLWIKHLIQMDFYPHEPIEEPIEVDIVFYMPIAMSTSKKRQKLMALNEIKHTKKPDIDNIIKKYFDAMNGIVYKDDRQIWHVSATKKYSTNPRTEIKLKWE